MSAVDQSHQHILFSYPIQGNICSCTDAEKDDLIISGIDLNHTDSKPLMYATVSFASSGIVTCICISSTYRGNTAVMSRLHYSLAVSCDAIMSAVYQSYQRSTTAEEAGLYSTDCKHLSHSFGIIGIVSISLHILRQHCCNMSLTTKFPLQLHPLSGVQMCLL